MRGFAPLCLAGVAFLVSMVACSDLESGSANRVPVAVIHAFPQSGPAPLTVALDARASLDRDGIIAAFRWTSTAGHSESSAEASMTFDTPGEHTITLEVQDDDGATARDSQAITVTGASQDNDPPVAFFTSSPPASEGGTVPWTIEVDASDSQDVDGTISAYEWRTSTGDEASGITATFTFREPGLHDVVLTVTDDDGATGSYTLSYQVYGSSDSSNRAPEPEFTITPTGGPAPLTVRLDAVDSRDPDGTIREYRWTSSDGKNEEGRTAFMTFVSPGDYTITLEVEDDEGATGLTTKNLTVTEAEAEPPVSGFRIDLRFSGSGFEGFNESRRDVFAGAAARWAEVIVGDVTDLPSVSVPPGACLPSDRGYTGPIDDLLISAIIEPIDGPGGTLGQAGFCYYRGDTLLPAYGVMRFDTADIDWVETRGSLGDVILHEMGHVVGVGALWEARSLLTYSGSNCLESATRPTFGGVGGMSAYRSLGATGEVPVEDNHVGGTGCVHWDEEVFGGELMTGYWGGGMSLSGLTTGSLEDLGYLVDGGAADEYSLPLCSPNCVFPLEAAPFHSQPVTPKGSLSPTGQVVPPGND